jgi:hypothetical protein
MKSFILLLGFAKATQDQMLEVHTVPIGRYAYAVALRIKTETLTCSKSERTEIYQKHADMLIKA